MSGIFLERPIRADEAGKFGPALDAAARPLVQSRQRRDVISGMLAMGAIGEAGRGAVPLLVARLKEDDAGLARMASRQLARLGPVGDAGLPVLIERIKAASEKEAPFAIFALRDFRARAKDAVPVLIDKLASDDSNVRDAAISVLAAIGPDAKDAIPALQKLAVPGDEGRGARRATDVIEGKREYGKPDKE